MDCIALAHTQTPCVQGRKIQGRKIRADLKAKVESELHMMIAKVAGALKAEDRFSRSYFSAPGFFALEKLCQFH
jgi:hypothetical protein